MSFCLKKSIVSLFAAAVAAAPALAQAPDEPNFHGFDAQNFIYMPYFLQSCDTEGTEFNAQILLGTTDDNYFNEFREMDGVKPRLPADRAELFYQTMPYEKRFEYADRLWRRMGEEVLQGAEQFSDTGLDEPAAAADADDIALKFTPQTMQLEDLARNFARAAGWEDISGAIMLIEVTPGSANCTDVPFTTVRDPINQHRRL